METKQKQKFAAGKGTKRPEQLNESGTLFDFFILKRFKKQTKKQTNKQKKQAKYTQENLEKVELELFNKTHNTISDL